MRQGGAELHRDGVGDAPGQLPKEPALFEAENAPPDSVQRHRDDGRLDVPHDKFEAAPEGKEVADARDLAFGKDADHLAVPDGLAGRSQRA